MGHGILGGVFDNTSALLSLSEQDFVSTVLGFPSDPFIQNVMINRTKYCMLSNMSNTINDHPHRRTIVDYDGNVLELTPSASIGAVPNQLFPPLRGIQPSDTDFFVTSQYTSGPDIFKYNVSTSTWQKVFSMPDIWHGAHGGGVIVVKDNVYYFGDYLESGAEGEGMAVEKIDLNAGTITRLATHQKVGDFAFCDKVIGVGTDHEDIIYMAAVNTTSGPSPLQLWKYVISSNTISLLDTFQPNSNVFFGSDGILVPNENGEIFFFPKFLNIAANDKKPVKMYPGQSRFDILLDTGLFWSMGAMFNPIPSGVIAYSAGDRYPLFIKFKK